MDHCRALRRDGSPCKGPARASGFCFAHDEALRETVRAARAAGGKGKATPRRAARRLPDDLQGVLTRLYACLAGLEDGSVEPKTATAMATVATAITRIYDVSVIEERIRRIEESHAARTHKAAR